MNLDLYIILAPIISVLVIYVIEKIILKEKNKVKNRIKSIIGLQITNQLFGYYFLSSLLLVPLVFLLAPLQIFSFSNLEINKQLNFLLCFLFLDFIAYLTHRLHHVVPFLWRFHRLHHSDQHVDSLTVFLQHPLENFSTFIVTVSMAVIFDIPVIVLVIYNIFILLHGPFAHMQRLIPAKVDKYLKYITITPNFHKIHHSIKRKEENSNFGLFFVFWDFLLKTSSIKNTHYVKKMKFGVDNNKKNFNYNIINFLKNPLLK